MNLVEMARKYRPIIEKAMQGVPDKEASEAPYLMPKMKYTGETIDPGFRIQWRGEVYKATNFCYNREDQNPDNAPNLWEKIPYKDGFRIIPEVVTVTSAFAFGERGWWKGVLYESTMSDNVYNPEQYPQFWKKVEE